MHTCMLVACILFYKIFSQTETYSLFHSSSCKSSQLNKMSNKTTEKKQLRDIDHSLAFNSKVSSVVDDYIPIQ